MASTGSVAESSSAASRGDKEHRHHDHDIDATARVLSAKYLERNSGKVSTHCRIGVTIDINFIDLGAVRKQPCRPLLFIAYYIPLTFSFIHHWHP